MRRSLISVPAALALVAAMAACDTSTDDPPATSPPGTIGTDITEDETAVDVDVPTTGEDTETTTAPGDETQSTAGAEGEVEGGEEGQAAADVAKAFFVAIINADPEACDYMLSRTDPTQPMVEVEEDYEECQDQVPLALSGQVAAQGLDEDSIALLEAMTIRGADVDGEVAIVDRDNFIGAFAESMGGNQILLRNVDSTWYVDMDAFGTSDDS